MPKLTKEHRSAAEAVSAVSLLFSKAGAIGEQVLHDYGEDMFLLTNLRDQVDPFRIWIQIKATKVRLDTKGRYSFKFRVDHLIRWMSHADPILICVYDLETKKVFAFQPQLQFTLWQLHTTRRKTITTYFRAEDRLSRNSINNFIWQCRILHFSKMLAMADAYEMYSPVREPRRRRERVIIVFNFLRSLGIIEEKTVCSDIPIRTKNFLRNNKNSGDKVIREEGIKMGVMLSFLAFVNNKYKNGLPANLLEHGTELLGRFVRVGHQQIWQEFCRLSPSNKWEP